VTRIVTVFETRFCRIVHDTEAGGARVPQGFGRFRRVQCLAEFLRLLHEQRAIHRALKVPCRITQEIPPP
jgi:hypothetical protein